MVVMSVQTKKPTRATVYLEPVLHKALRMKAAETDVSISDLVNDAIKGLLSEDESDLAAFEDRKKEPRSDFATFLKQLRSDGKL